MPTSPASRASSACCDVLDGGALLVLSGLAVAPDGAAEPVVSGLDLTLSRGDCVALVGPSGSGKTTLLRTIAGVLTPRAGTVSFTGRERGGIALVAQHHDLVEPLRVDKNVLAGGLGRMSTWRALRLLLHTAPHELIEADAALAMVGLEGMARRRTSDLSGGERQRVAIARALVQAPGLMLADEPVAALDPANAEAILKLLTGLARATGTGLICSLHQPALARRHCDRVIELRDGRAW
jgi:phosphonate transport system ATP-binding protein